MKKKHSILDNVLLIIIDFILNSYNSRPKGT